MEEGQEPSFFFGARADFSFQVEDEFRVVVRQRFAEQGGWNPVIADNAGDFFNQVDRLPDVAPPVGDGC